ncbi:uncharacterized protein [Setaria viridis]|uniref:uncharacterized protein n=1 Tax=Setaria viridis TaxID=4556 RepID=UPI003B3A7272
MTKWGWIDVRDKFLEATGKFRTSEQFGYKYRCLRQMWTFINHLRTKCTGLGHREDGSVVASDSWWEGKTEVNDESKPHCVIRTYVYYLQEFMCDVYALQGHANWYELKDGWPPYIDLLDRMFSGVAVTGETSFVPGVNRQISFISSGEDDDAEADGGTPRSCATPVSTGSKRSTSSLRSTGTNPKKNKGSTPRSQRLGPVVERAVVDNIKQGIDEVLEKRKQDRAARHAHQDQSRDAVLAQLQQTKQDEKEERRARKEEIKQVTDAAKALGVHLMDANLWQGVVKICKDEDLRTVFIVAPDEARLSMIKQNAPTV